MRKVARGEVSFTSGFPVSTPERTIFDLVADDEDPYLDDPAGHTDLLLGMSLALFQPKAPTSSYSRGREEESKSTRKLNKVARLSRHGLDL